MSKAEKVSEPTMEEILASIRKIIAEEPAGAKSNGVGVPPIEAPRVRPLAPAGVGTAAERIASFSVGAGSATPQQPSAVVGSHLAAPQVPAPRTDVAQVARRASKEDQNALSHLLLDEDLADLVEPLPVATRPATAAKAIQPAGEATTMSPVASDRADPEASARPGPRPGPVPVAAPAVAASPVGGAGNSDIAGWRFQRPGSHEPVYPPAKVKETDRIAAMATELTKLGAEVEAGPEGLALSAWVRSKSLKPKATFQVFVQAQNQSDLAITAGPASQGLPESLPLGALPDAQPVGGGAEG